MIIEIARNVHLFVANIKLMHNNRKFGIYVIREIIFSFIM